MRELVLDLNRKKGITFLISSHILDELSRMATHYGFIDKGHIVRQMSSEELKNECRKSIRMTVNDTGLLARVLEEKGVEYKILDSTHADIYAEVNFSDMARACEAAGCTIRTMEEHDESLEAFYLSLLGGRDDV